MSQEDQIPILMDSQLIEAFARVVAIEGSLVWLEPEQSPSCGGCATAGTCGTKGIGTVANRLEARRFSLPHENGLNLGDRIVVGIPENVLVKAALAVYALPLVTSLVIGGLAQWFVGMDLVTLTAMVLGLILGLFLTRHLAKHLASQGAPHFLRRVTPSFSCTLD